MTRRIIKQATAFPHAHKIADHSPYADFLQWVVDDQNRVPDQEALDAYVQQSTLTPEDYQNITNFLERTSAGKKLYRGGKRG